MVRNINYVVRESTEGNSYVNLELQGDIVLVQSMNTGRFYATAKKCRITSTFDEQTAKSLIGRELPGRIDRVETDPYEYTVPETGEVIKLAHSWQYFPEGAPEPSRVQMGMAATL